MAVTLIDLDVQAAGKVFTFGTTSASGEALLTLNKGIAAVTTVVLDVKGSQNIAGDLNLIGNLNITGNVNATSTTNTNIADITITLNDGGSSATAVGGGINIEGDANSVIGALRFISTGSRFTIGNGTVQNEIVDVSTVQTLTNKSISGNQITSAVANATLAATVTTNANLTGPITSVGNVISVGTQTGTGSVFVMQASPTLTTPNIGVATGTSIATSGAHTSGTAASVDGVFVWQNATNAFTQTFRASNPGASIVYVLPSTAPVTGQVLVATTPAAGVSTMSWSAASAGTVTSVSVTTANGVSGVVATASSTPAITLTLGAITPTSVAATGSVSGSNLSGTNTGDQTTISGNAGSATLTAVTDDAATASAVYPTWVGGITGNLAQKVTSTRLSFIPSSGALTSGSFIKSGGTAVQFLKADGSSDSTTYLTTAVTTVSVATANGISGTVATASTTPVITLSLGAITPTSVNGNVISTGTGTLSLSTFTLNVTGAASIAGTHTGSSSGSNTGDQTITLTGDVTGSGTGSFATTLVKYQRATVVSGTQDGVNKVFSLSNVLKTGSDQVYMNGQLLTPGASNDYVYDGTTTITLQAAFTAPSSTKVIRVYGTY